MSNRLPAVSPIAPSALPLPEFIVNAIVALVNTVAIRIFSALSGSLYAGLPSLEEPLHSNQSATPTNNGTDNNGSIATAQQLSLPTGEPVVSQTLSKSATALEALEQNSDYVVHRDRTRRNLEKAGFSDVNIIEKLAHFMGRQAVDPHAQDNIFPEGVYAVQKANGGPINHYYTAPDAQPNPIPGNNQLPERTMIPTFCLTYGTSGHRIKAVGSFEQQKWQTYQQALLDRELQVIPLDDGEMIVLEPTPST